MIKLKIVQYRGPFTTSDRITIDPEYDRTWVHIGIQIPERQPIAYTYYTQAPPQPDLSIGELDGGTISYRVNDTGILEFEEIAQNSWQIRFNRDLPVETIIDIQYQDVEEI